MCLDAGMAVAAVNYRLSGNAPYPAQMHDCARAVQFLRSKAGALGLDPLRVSATGGSAGGTIALWLAFHADLARQGSDDPIERQSTRLSCVCAANAPTLLEPPPSVGERPQPHPALAQFLRVPESDVYSTPHAPLRWRATPRP